MKKAFCTFGWKQWLCLNHLVWEFFKKLTFKNNRKQNFKTFYLKFQTEFKHPEELHSTFFKTALFFTRYTYIDPQHGILPPKNLLLFEGFHVLRNWQCSGKILDLLFSVYFVSKRRDSSEKWTFSTSRRKQCFCLNSLRQELLGI